MLFTGIMSRKKIYSYSGLLILVLFTWMLTSTSEKKEEFTEVVKISLREVGNQLLLSQQDSTSLILPIVEVSKSKYKLAFEKQLSLEPDSIVSIIKRSFERAELPVNYRVEVLQCADEEVAYSYEFVRTEVNSIIPCKGRNLPESCYEVDVRFTEKTASSFNKPLILFALVLFLLGLMEFFYFRRKPTLIAETSDESYTAIGSFQFHREQNKLVKEAVEISLSKKECELLAIFVAQPNQIIKRDELTKRVWEDHGVIVGRSLDTYISKLRKKLKSDDSIKLTNVHGVGYKLEMD